MGETNKAPGYTRLSDLPQEELLNQIILEHSEPYHTFTVDTTTVQANPKAYGVKGGVFQIIGVTNNDLNAYVNVRFNRSQMSSIQMFLGDRIITPFREVFIDWPAQSGITVTFAVAQEASNVFTFDKNLQGNLGNVTAIGTVNLINTLTTVGTVTNVGTVGVVSSITAIPGLTSLPAGGAIVNADALHTGGAASFTTVYTVTAGKSLHLLNALFYAQDGGSGGTDCGLIITNAADVLQYYLARGRGGIAAPGMIHPQTYLPYQQIIPAGYKIRLSGSSGIFTAVISGYEV